MILASSSGDHLDCFFAGDWAGCSRLDDSLLAGTADRGWGGGSGATLVATLDGIDNDREIEAAEMVDWMSSSSLALSRDEISTVNDARCCWSDRIDTGVVALDQDVLPCN